MGDWLGTEIFNADKEFYTFLQARKIVHSCLKSRDDWKKYIKSESYDLMIPKAPMHTYKVFING